MPASPASSSVRYSRFSATGEAYVVPRVPAEAAADVDAVLLASTHRYGTALPSHCASVHWQSPRGPQSPRSGAHGWEVCRDDRTRTGGGDRVRLRRAGG